jgi:hypothetical protein
VAAGVVVVPSLEEGLDVVTGEAVGESVRGKADVKMLDTWLEGVEGRWVPRFDENVWDRPWEVTAVS